MGREIDWQNTVVIANGFSGVDTMIENRKIDIENHKLEMGEQQRVIESHQRVMETHQTAIVNHVLAIGATRTGISERMVVFSDMDRERRGKIVEALSHKYEGLLRVAVTDDERSLLFNLYDAKMHEVLAILLNEDSSD
jgi:hypothetical protein